MEPRFALKTQRHPNTMQGCRASFQIPSTMETSWNTPMPLLTRHHKSKSNSNYSLRTRPHSATTCIGSTDSRIPLRTTLIRPHTTIVEDSTMSSKNLGNLLGTNNVRHPSTMPECWTSSKTLRPHTATIDSRSSIIRKLQVGIMESTSSPYSFSSLGIRPHTTVGNLRSPSKVREFEANFINDSSTRRTPTIKSSGSLNQKPSIAYEKQHVEQRTTSTSTNNSCSRDKDINNLSPKLPNTSLYKHPSTSSIGHPSPNCKISQCVKNYSSPNFSSEGLLPSKLSKESIVDAQSLKHPNFGSESPKFDGFPQPSRIKVTHDVFDPSLNLRNPSINGDFKVNVGPMESLVTQMPRPTHVPSETSTLSISQRKKLEAALKMYPRNTWGPITKWGYQEEMISGKQYEKDHFINNKDQLEKQRLESRRFGHQRHWMKFKNPTNFWEEHEARESTAFVHKKDQFLTNSEKMLHVQNDNRIARAKHIDEARRTKKRWREFKRLEKREGEYIDKMESEQKLREDPRIKSNDSGVGYNIVTLEYPSNYAGDLLRFEDAQIRWRQCMRALRIQSKQSGARMYNVLSWKPKTPCCIPPPKPTAPIPPDPNLAPTPRKPDLPLPKNMLHLKEKCTNIPVACTNDNRTNW